MASVFLPSAVLQSVDGSTAVVLHEASSVVTDKYPGGKVSTYADGRRRVITGPERAESATVEIGPMERSRQQTVESMRGQTVRYRNAHGVHVFGFLSSIGVKESGTTADRVRMGLSLTILVSDEL